MSTLIAIAGVGLAVFIYIGWKIYKANRDGILI